MARPTYILPRTSRWAKTGMLDRLLAIPKHPNIVPVRAKRRKRTIRYSDGATHRERLRRQSPSLAPNGHAPDMTRDNDMKRIHDTRRHFSKWTTSIAMILGAMCATEALGEPRINPRVTDHLSSHEIARILITIKPTQSEAGFSHPANQPGRFVRSILGENGSTARAIGTLPMAVADATEEEIQRLRDNPSIAAIDLDEPQRMFLHHSLPLMKIDDVHESGIRGGAYSIAIIDTGVNYEHPLFEGKLQAEACFSTRARDTNAYTTESLCPNKERVDTTPRAGLHCKIGGSECSHGTHVANVALGGPTENDTTKSSGVANEAGLISIQVFTELRDEWVCGGPSKTPCARAFISDQLRALEHVKSLAETHEIAAINLSLGGSPKEGHCDATDPRAGIIDTLRTMGIATVAASGNDAHSNAISDPACLSSAITVGASKPRSIEVDTTFSNTSEVVDFLAPGTSVRSAVTERAEQMTGTSMAAPHIAGVIALLRSHVPEATVDQMELALRTTARETKDPRTDTVLHFPDVSKAARALNLARRATEPETPKTPKFKHLGHWPDTGRIGPRIIVVLDEFEERDQNAMRSHVRTRLGADTLVQTSGKNRLVIERRNGFDADELGYFIEQFGENTKFYHDGLSSTQQIQ